jgi:two-component sensor histidine kinase
MQASQEELLASNEELQSANEELQSANEELQKVNSELQSKIDELVAVGDDVKDLLDATDIAMLFLDAAAPCRSFLAGTGMREGANECLLALVDVSERELSHKALDRAANEKAILLSELQHRLKNSLNVVYSLLGIGQSQIEDEKAIDLDFRIYLENLIGPLLDTYSPDNSRFRLVTELQSVKLDAHRAALAGLMFNELISNAIKYAYPGNASGELRISLMERDGAIELRVSDEGRGLPSGFDYTTSDSMGFTILRMLTEQIGADLRIESGPRGGLTTILRIKP